MNIISDFKDYYDSGMRYGIDNLVQYVRHTSVQEFKTNQFPVSKITYNDTKLYPPIESWRSNNCTRANLYFCGKVYPIFRTNNFSNGIHCSYMMAHQFIKEAKERINQVPSVNSTTTRPNYFDIPSAEWFLEKRRDVPRHWSGHTITRFKELMDQNEYKNKKADLEIFQHFQVPSLILDFGRDQSNDRIQRVTLNPVLKDLDFVQILDPYSCFQEIQMFLSGVLAKPDIAPLRVGGDKVIIQQKGFDEMSFRTNAPGHKKENRKKNKELKRNKA